MSDWDRDRERQLATALGTQVWHPGTMATQQRTRKLDRPCPRCGGALMQDEKGLMVAELASPARWVATKRYCLAGCPLTVADFPGEE